MAGLYHGHVLEFPQIRIDCFTQPTENRPQYIPYPLTLPDDESSHPLQAGPSKQKGPERSGVYRAPQAQYYLLTHAHADHLSGLTNLHNNCTILCSENTKTLLLNYERRKDRVAFDTAVNPIVAEAERNNLDDAWIYCKIRENGIEQRKVYEGLKAKMGEVDGNSVPVDCIKTIPYNTVIPLTLSSSSGSTIVNLVMLDANHCPGSSMFLLWSPFPPFTSVLHTGDMRADDGFIQDLIRKPLVQPFFQGYPVKAKTGSGRIMKDKRIPVSGSSQRFFEGDVYRNTGDIQSLRGGGGAGLRRQLDRIYLDTSLLVGSCDMPSREEAIGNLIHLINGFPADTTFHLHCWTFGYEEVLKALARTYDTKIHLDRWQLQNHLLLQGDPLLQQLGTSDPSSLFHACERSGGGCETIKTSRNRVVRVEFVEEHVVEHAIKMKHVAAQMVSAQAGEAEWPSKIYCPLARHVTLPELEVLTSLFKPRSLSPNTLIPQLQGCDYYMMEHVFKNTVADGGANIKRECLEWFARERHLNSEADVERLLDTIFTIFSVDDPDSGPEEDERLDEGRNPSSRVKTEDQSDVPATERRVHQPCPNARHRAAIRAQQVASYRSRVETYDQARAGPSRAPGYVQRGPDLQYGASDEDTEVEKERSREAAMTEGRLKRKRRRTDSRENDASRLREKPVAREVKNRRIEGWMTQVRRSPEPSLDRVKHENHSDEERPVESRSARESTARMALRYGA